MPAAYIYASRMMTAVLHSSHPPTQPATHVQLLVRHIVRNYTLNSCCSFVSCRYNPCVTPCNRPIFRLCECRLSSNTFATDKLNPFFGTRSCVRRRRRRRRTTGHLYPSVYFVFVAVFRRRCVLFLSFACVCVSSFSLSLFVCV